LRIFILQVLRGDFCNTISHRADVPGLPRFRPLLGKEPIFSTNLRALWQLDFPLDSCNGNLREERIHRNYAKSPGGMPRRVFRCALARAAARGVVFAKKQENTGENAADESPAHLEPPRPWQNNRW
jgi:hypothetical protein